MERAEVLWLPRGRCSEIARREVSQPSQRGGRHESTPAPRRGVSPIYRISRILVVFVYGFAVVAISLLAMAFFLRLFNANASAPFVEWVYRATNRIMQPFRGIFPAVEGESGSVLDVSLLFAMFMYGLLAIGMHALIDWIDRKMAAARWAARWEQAAGPPAVPPAAPRVTNIPEAAPPQAAQPPPSAWPPGSA